METAKKKIVFVITKSNWGGAQRYVFDLATSLPKDAYMVEVILGGNGVLADKLRAFGISVTTLEVMQRDVNIKKEFLAARELFRLFRKIKPDIVHLNSSKAGGIGALMARLAGVKNIIFTAHAWAFNENRSLISKLLISVLHWATVMLSHRTIAVSDYVKEQVSHMIFMKNKIQVIHLGMDSFTLKSKKEARALIGKSDQVESQEICKEIWIGTIAELHPVKGIPYAIDAISFLEEEFSDIRFYIIGEGEQRNLIEKQIIKRRLENNVSLVGFIDEARSYLSAFDIFVLPSLSEAFGYSLIEAGHASLPVVATMVGGIPEVVDDAGILVSSRNPRVLADALKALIISPEKRNELGKSLNHRVITLFTQQEMLRKTIEIYHC